MDTKEKVKSIKNEIKIIENTMTLNELLIRICKYAIEHGDMLSVEEITTITEQLKKEINAGWDIWKKEQ